MKIKTTVLLAAAVLALSACTKSDNADQAAADAAAAADQAAAAAGDAATAAGDEELVAESSAGRERAEREADHDAAAREKLEEIRRAVRGDG